MLLLLIVANRTGVYLLSLNSVCQLKDVEKIAKVTDCMPVYVAKGISLGCLVYGRCLYKGYGVEKNEEKSKIWFKQVCKIKTVDRFYGRGCHPQILNITLLNGLFTSTLYPYNL